MLPRRLCMRSTSTIVASDMSGRSFAGNYFRRTARQHLQYSRTRAELCSSCLPPQLEIRRYSTSGSSPRSVNSQPMFVVAGFAWCYLALRDPQPTGTRDVQARLSIKELIAGRLLEERRDRPSGCFRRVQWHRRSCEELPCERRVLEYHV